VHQCRVGYSAEKEGKEMIRFDIPEPDFNHFRDVLLLKRYERVPLAEFWIDEKFPEALLGRKIEGEEDWIEFRSRLGFDFHTPGIAYFRGPSSVEEKARSYHFESAGIIHDEAEIERYPWPKPSGETFREIDILQEKLPRGMKCVLAFDAIHQTSWELVGFVPFMTGVIERPDFIRNIIEKIGESFLKLVREIPKHAVIGAVVLADDSAYRSGTMLPPDFLRENIFPWYKKYARILHEAGIPVIFHSDGNLMEVIPDIIDAGIDALHPIEPEAMDILEVKRRFGDRLCIIGNISLAGVLARGTPEDVKKEARARMEALAPLGGYCLSSSNSIPPNVPIENFLAMIEAVHQYNREKFG